MHCSPLINSEFIWRGEQCLFCSKLFLAFLFTPTVKGWKLHFLRWIADAPPNGPILNCHSPCRYFWKICIHLHVYFYLLPRLSHRSRICWTVIQHPSNAEWWTIIGLPIAALVYHAHDERLTPRQKKSCQAQVFSLASYFRRFTVALKLNYLMSYTSTVYKAEHKSELCFRLGRDG